MKAESILLSIAIMAVVTYLIRALPLVLIRREIKSRFLRSFLYYVPYVTLSVMTFPAILYCTGSVISAAIALGVAAVLGLWGAKLPTVAAAACAVVFVAELIIL